MSIIRVSLARGFMLGDDVVLLAMDGAGITVFSTALKEAVQRGHSRLEHEGAGHEFWVRTGSSSVELAKTRVVWRFDKAKAMEVVDDLAALGDRARPGHHYVDISEPADTLVLSLDEYIGQ